MLFSAKRKRSDGHGCFPLRSLCTRPKKNSAGILAGIPADTRHYKMSGFAFDQAEGLRRLLGHETLRVICVASGKPRSGQTSVAANLACALEALGKSILIIDEGIGADSCAAHLGLAPRCELAQVLKAKVTLAQAILPYSPTIHLLPAREGLRRLSDLSPTAHDALARAMQALSFKPDIILIDLAADRTHATLAAAAAADAVLVVLGPGHPAITQAYSLIKQLAQAYGQRQLHLLATKIKDDIDATAIYNNMADAATRYLQARLHCLPPIPWDDTIKRANKLGKPVVESFPEASSSAAFRSLAQAVATWPPTRSEGCHLEGFLHRLIMSGRLADASVRV